MMIIITVTFVITNEIHFWTLPVHTITTANTRGWSPLIFNMATILTKQVKDVHLLHSSGHTPARDTSFFSAICEENWQSICLFWKLADWYPSPPSSGTNLGKINWKEPDVQPLFKFIQLGTRAWWTRVPIWVFWKQAHESALFSIYFTQISTRVWWARVLYKVPELEYPSSPSSGTNLCKINW